MKKIFKKILFLTFPAWLGFYMSSCNYLDVDPYFNDMFSIDSVFSNKEYLLRYLWGASGHLPNEGILYANAYGPFETACDECLMTYNNATYAGTAFALGEVTVYNNYYDFWSRYYKGIRKTNNILTRISECQNLSVLERREILGMTYFLKGYLCYHLLQLYGPFVILPEKPFQVDADLEELSYPRATFDECVDYICNHMQKAYEYLPPERSTDEIERPTQGAALAVISRLRLYGASPLFNGEGTYFAGWQTADGQPFLSQIKDNRKWALAAAAAKQLIERNQYTLNTEPKTEGPGGTMPLDPSVPTANFPDGAGDIDPYLSYSNLFNGEIQPQHNAELIYQGGNYNQANYSFDSDRGGQTLIGLTQKLVDAFYMKDGKDINDRHEGFTYSNTSFSTESESFSGNYQIRAGVNSMYLNREPRFYAIVGFNGRYFHCVSAENAAYPGTVRDQAWYYPKDRKTPTDNPDSYSLTGYTSVKYLHNEDSPKGSIKYKYFPAFRYAEILLNYVEAMNNLQQEYTVPDVTGESSISVGRNIPEMVKYFNMVRYRAGLPGITEADAADPDKMFDLIVRERQIEFAHEGRRYHDLRRWMMAEREENGVVEGLNLEISVGKGDPVEKRIQFHTPVPLKHDNAQRIFTPRMYFYPIRKEVMDKNPLLIQNYGW